MIVRELVKHPELIETFDFFNDADDTISWLLMMGENKLAVKLSFKSGFYFGKRLIDSVNRTTKEEK